MAKDKKALQGIHDPWRLGSPEWEPPENEAPAGAKGSKLAFDWDIQPDTHYVLRHSGVTIKFLGVESPEGAIAVLINAFDQDPQLQRALTDAGFVRAAGADSGNGFTMKVQDQMLTCRAAHSVQEGLQRLSTALRKSIRDDRTMKHRLYNLGIVPIMQ